jgi:hypothetical protein
MRRPPPLPLIYYNSFLPTDSVRKWLPGLCIEQNGCLCRVKYAVGGSFHSAFIDARSERLAPIGTFTVSPDQVDTACFNVATGTSTTVDENGALSTKGKPVKRSSSEGEGEMGEKVKTRRRRRRKMNEMDDNMESDVKALGTVKHLGGVGGEKLGVVAGSSKIVDKDKEEEEKEEEKSDDIVCQVCKIDERDDVVLLCDRCNTGYHTYCVNLVKIPKAQWFCVPCQVGRNYMCVSK